MFIFDSDHISIIQLHTPPSFGVLSQRIAQHRQTDFYVTIVSFHEQILGWNSYIDRAKAQVSFKQRQHSSVTRTESCGNEKEAASQAADSLPVCSVGRTDTAGDLPPRILHPPVTSRRQDH